MLALLHSQRFGNVDFTGGILGGNSRLLYSAHPRPATLNTCSYAFNDTDFYNSSDELKSVYKMAINGQRGPNSHYPSINDVGSSITKQGFKITTRKLPILKAEPIEQMTAELGITPPEMIFGDNLVAIEHATSGWNIKFNAFDALDRVDKTGGSMLQVAHSKEWQSTRYAGLPP